MIKICERCWHPVTERERVLSLAHVRRVLPGGDVEWDHSYVHVEPCGDLVQPAVEPDRGDWDSSRGLAAGAVHMIASRPSPGRSPRR